MARMDWAILFLLLILAIYVLGREIRGAIDEVGASIDKRLDEITKGLERIASGLEGYHADHPDNDRMVEATDGIARIIKERDRA